MLADTKERALPAHPDQTLEDYLVYLKHIALYAFAKKFCANQSVLDMGCGEGYGSDALAGVARFLVAADYSFETVLHAQAKYHHTNTAFVVCDAQALPFKAESFDTIISFEVIEHIPVVSRYLAEIGRALKVSGVSIISTPNRRMRLLPFQKPWNRFHLREYDDRGLARAMSDVFARVQTLGITASPPILEIEKQRVKQNPLIAYPKMLAQMWLPEVIYQRLRSVKERWFSSVSPHPATQEVANFSADDYSISENALRDCINLIVLGESNSR